MKEWPEVSICEGTHPQELGNVQIRVENQALFDRVDDGNKGHGKFIYKWMRKANPCTFAAMRTSSMDYKWSLLSSLTSQIAGVLESTRMYAQNCQRESFA